MDTHITIILSVLTSLSQELLETIVRLTIFFLKNFASVLSRYFPTKNVKISKTKTLIFKNDKFYIVAKFKANYLKTQRVVYTLHFLSPIHLLSYAW